MNDSNVDGIQSIGDTARWVAYYRALETERPDAIFRDPFARDLAGDVGKRMADQNRAAAWSMIVRTAVMDEIIMREVNLGCDTVLNLGAGMDTRPQRLALPASLRWIEVDLPEMIEYKNEKLVAAPASCSLERIALDLADLAARREVFVRVNTRARHVLVLSEGLLVYLSEEQVAQLGRDLYECPNFTLWLFDQTSPAIVAMIMRRYHRGLAAANAPMQFAPLIGLAFHAAQGWSPREERDMIGEAHRLKREMPMAGLLWALGMLRPHNAKFWSTIALMERVPL